MAVTRDSAGIAITENPATLLEQAQLLVADSASVTIGALDGAEHEQLFQVRGLRQLADGSILVLNAGTHELRRYDASGRWLGSFGRRGEGPGEMQFPVTLLPIDADTSWVLDIALRRFHVVDATGAIVGSIPLSGPFSGLVGLVDSTTAITAEPRQPRGVYDQVLPSTVTLRRVDIRTGAVDTLDVLPGGRQEYVYTQGDLVRSVSVPFTVMPVVRVRGGAIHVTDGLSPEVRVYDASGELRRIMRVMLDPAPVTSSDWDAVVEGTLEARTRNQRGESRLAAGELDRHRKVYAEMARPQHLPFFDEMLLTDPAHVWVRHYSPPGPVQRWIALDSVGRVVARATVPTSLLIRELTREKAFGRSIDAMDVEYVKVYPLR